ncbi:enolase C-terminal domain-like protein [Bauldia sp.]|uniref:enolase C-terminal domain-like protein n=1 Tax=Bauldia sp. TaxID=2575872 RepID=UPI003BACA8BD
MTDRSIISRIELRQFTFEAANLGVVGDDPASLDRAGGTPGGAVEYAPGQSTTMSRYAIAIETADGCRGEYVTHYVGTQSAFAQTAMLAPMLVGRDAEAREGLYDDMKRELRQYDRMGQGPIDIALWDLAGKKYGASVSRLLGGYRHRLPAYASTYHGDRNGGLDSKEAFADFANYCADIGYRAFKIHGWHEGDAREEAENLLYVRKVVGDGMTLMIDCACELRTFADALYVGRACDDANYFWYEDPFRDAGTSAHAHKLLREKLRTPILQTEHIRGVEPKADFILAGGTDFLRSDPEYDMGITGAMKIAHLAEALGVDCEVHATGPAHRAVVSAMRNTNFYEIALVGPDCPNAIPPVYTCGYSDQLDCIDRDGSVGVPDGPGLGVTYDWDYIRSNTIQLFEYT